jgi:hypothetical protein
MAVLGRWNWWLPDAVARLVRVEASPLTPQTSQVLLPSKTRRS